MDLKSNEQSFTPSRKEILVIVSLPAEKVYLFKFLLEACGHLAFPTIKKGGVVELRLDAEERSHLEKFLASLPFEASWEMTEYY